MPAAATGGTSGTSSPSDATNAQECRYTGAAGANGWSCDYVTIEFSEPLPEADLQIEVTTSDGDVLVPVDPFSTSDRPPVLVVNSSADGAHVVGFTIRGAGHVNQDYSPEWVDVVVRIGGSTAADSRLPLTHSCIAIAGHQWCWVAQTEVLEVTP